MLFFVSALSGCTQVVETVERKPKPKKTAALIITEKKDIILKQSESILGRPKSVYTHGKKGSELEIRVYPFSYVYDLNLCFYKDIFVQAILIEAGSKDRLNIRPDYKEVTENSSGPLGYTLASDDESKTINTIWK